MLGAFRGELIADTAAFAASIQHKELALYTHNLAMAARIGALLSGLGLAMLVRHSSMLVILAEGEGNENASAIAFAFWWLSVISVCVSLHVAATSHLVHMLAPEAALYSEAGRMSRVVRQTREAHGRLLRHAMRAPVLFFAAGLALLLVHSPAAGAVALLLLGVTLLATGVNVVHADAAFFGRAPPSPPLAQLQPQRTQHAQHQQQHTQHTQQQQQQQQQEQQQQQQFDCLSKLASMAPASLPRREGLLTKRGQFVKTWRARWFVLDRGVLRYFERRGGALKGELQLFGERASCQLLPASEGGAGVGPRMFNFVVHVGKRELALRTHSEESAHEWADEINAHASWSNT